MHGKPAERKEKTAKSAIYPPERAQPERHNIRSTSELCFPVFDIYCKPEPEPPKK